MLIVLKLTKLLTWDHHPDSWQNWKLKLHHYEITYEQLRLPIIKDSLESLYDPKLNFNLDKNNLFVFMLKKSKDLITCYLHVYIYSVQK